MSKFKRFTGFGLEAELWEEKQEEAARLIEHLKSLAVLAGEQLINMSSRMGRWDAATPRRELFALVDSVDSMLQRMGVGEIEIDRAKKEFYKYVAIDIAHEIANLVRQKINALKDSELKRQCSEFFNDRRGKIVRMSAPLSMYDALTRFLSEVPLPTDRDRQDLSVEAQEWLLDLKEWLTRHRLRRPEVWFASDP